jgi:Uma2 family endonuclease
MHMNTAMIPTPMQPPVIPPCPIFRISVKRYHDMIQKGALTEDDAVELLERWIVQEMSKNPPHAGIVQRSNRRITALLPTGMETREQSAVTLKDSEPEPDIAFVDSSPLDYTDHHPYPADISALVEVSGSTFGTDRIDKARIYARAKIPVYWVNNLIDRQIEVFSDPDAAATPPA